jgi:hypothetical protein
LFAYGINFDISIISSFSVDLPIFLTFQNLSWGVFTEIQTGRG